MRVIYHDADGGEHETNWPDGTESTKHVLFKGATYVRAGVQDGVLHYRLPARG